MKTPVRSVQLVRQWRLIRHLSENPGGCQMEELCRVLGSNYRTIYRDFEALRAAGFPVMNRYEGKMAVWSIGKWWDKTFDEI